MHPHVAGTGNVTKVISLSEGRARRCAGASSAARASRASPRVRGTAARSGVSRGSTTPMATGASPSVSGATPQDGRAKVSPTECGLPNLASPQQSNRSKSATLALDPHFNLQFLSPDFLGEGHLKATGSTPDYYGATFSQGFQDLYGFSPSLSQRRGLLRHSLEFGDGNLRDLDHDWRA